MKLDEESALELAQTFGLKLLEQQKGLAAMFTLCMNAKVFTQARFEKELESISNYPDIKEFSDLLESLRTAKEDANLEDILRKYKGPVQ